MNIPAPLPVTVYKINPDGRERHYPSHLIAYDATSAMLEGPFTAQTFDAGYVVFRFGDRCLEWFYTDRWYNILELHDIHDDRLKGWYCNIARPAVIGESEIRFDDLALDLWVAPDGTTLLLDEAEFEAYPLDDEIRRLAWIAVDDLRALVKARQPPFDRLGS